MEEQVSIRCRRHRKRIWVERSWLDTSNWLCPRCYGKLSAVERKRYAPPEGWDPDVRDSRNRKVSSRHEICAPKKDKIDWIWNGRDKNREFNPSNPALRNLLPKHRVECRKCGETVPCNGTWLEKTKYLCPSCGSSMTDDAIYWFNRKQEYEDRTGDNRRKSGSNSVVNGVGWSDFFMTRASDAELYEAFKKGRISKTRYRIEMKRRDCPSFFEDVSLFPDREFGYV